MQLAGTAVTDRDVFELARVLREGGCSDVAKKLEKGLKLGTKILGLSITDRESILKALVEPTTDGLAALRGVLVREHDWRVRVGLM
jgi:hypothetical protein